VNTHTHTGLSFRDNDDSGDDDDEWESVVNSTSALWQSDRQCYFSLWLDFGATIHFESKATFIGGSRHLIETFPAEIMKLRVRRTKVAMIKRICAGKSSENGERRSTDGRDKRRVREERREEKSRRTAAEQEADFE
jgi:hypothetical protein